MLTEFEQKELDDLRHESFTIKDKIINLQNDIEDVKCEFNYLNGWKKGRGIGFFIMLVLTAICFSIEFFYIRIMTNSMTERFSTKQAMLEYATSSTALAFFSVLLFAVSIFTIILAIKYLLEMGRNKSIRKIAKNLGIKNYYNYAETNLLKENNLRTLMMEFRNQKSKIDDKISQLEVNEIPWYEI